MNRLTAVILALVLAPVWANAQPADSRLKKIRDTKTVAIAYRTDALPFSFQNGQEPAGYTVDLCKRVVASIEQQLKLQPLQVKWVPATSENRMELVRKGQADMECGSTSVTLGRMERVDFSSPVFVDATGLLVRKGAGVTSLETLAGKKVAVVAGTTNERALQAALKRKMLSATVVPVKSREEGVAALESGSVDALASDKLLLVGLAGKVKDASQYEILGDDLSFEQYAIVLPWGDAAFRLAVNRALAQIYSGDAIVEVFRKSFGPDLVPPPGLIVMYGLNAFPE
jgi:ABC-type amino acid transport substrate-binding protein